jgi:hypothetical protein
MGVPWLPPSMTSIVACGILAATLSANRQAHPIDPVIHREG